MIRKYKHIALLGALAVGLAAIGLIYAQLNHKDVSPRVASKSAKSGRIAGAPGPGSKDHGPKTKEERRQWFDESVRRSWDSFSAPADTAQALSFTLKFPKSQALGVLYGVYVDKYAPKEDRTAYIYYGDPADGMYIKANKFPKIDFKAWVGQQESNKNADILKSDNTPFLVDVNGYEGWGWEPGYNIINGNKEPKPGFVSWQEDDGVVYTVMGTYGPDGTSVQELLEIARSVSE